MIVLETVKGKGWEEAETRVPCHYMTVSGEQLRAYEEVSTERISKIDERLEAISPREGGRA